MNKKLNLNNFLLISLIFFIFNTFYFSFFTPPSNIIFYDIDTRMMSDEIIQIMQPSSIYDFIYDSIYGGKIIWGRFFHAIYALIIFFIKPLVSYFFTVPQIIIFINYNLLFFSLLIFNRVFLKNQYLKLLTLILMLTFEISSITLLKTTSLEIFLIALAIYYFENFSNKNVNNLKKTGFILGILFGIKFTNAPYIATFIIFLLSKKQIKKNISIYIFSLFGFIFGQPSILIPQTFKVYVEDVVSHLRYDEGYFVSNFDWFKIIYDNFGKTFIFLIIILVLKVLYINKPGLKLNENIFILAATIQLLAYLFSDGLIRAHYTKMPIIILLYYCFSLVEKYSNPILLALLIFFTVIFTVNSNLEQRYEISVFNSGSIELVDVEYNSLDQVQSMNQTLAFVKEYSKNENIPLIWWEISSKYYHPYSQFHWTSSEDPKNSNFYIKEMFERPEGFAFGKCSDYGGLAVFIMDKDTGHISQQLEKKQFEFLKQFKILNTPEDLNYGVFAKKNNGIPDDC